MIKSKRYLYKDLKNNTVELLRKAKRSVESKWLVLIDCPPIGELGEVNEMVLVGTDECPMLPSNEGMKV